MSMLTKIFFAAIVAGASIAGVAQTRWQQLHAMHDVRPLQGRLLDPSRLPAGIEVLHDLHYGADALETFDVYAPSRAHDAPVIFMVHGGGWRRGDKTARGVVQNKVAHWVPRGIIVVSVNYPLLPDAQPLQQARMVALALAVAQRNAPRWGGDPRRFALMGHSAGAHLIALISAEPSLATSQGALPWLGTVALDSAAYDVTSIMRGWHLRLYDNAFGSDPADWAAASPVLQLRARIAPFLAVCSSRRVVSCAQADAFAAAARELGSRAQVAPEDMRHGVINQALGQPSAYTSTVDAFLASLGPALAMRLH